MRSPSEAVVFERAYTHSPQTLPSHASLLTGQLPSRARRAGRSGLHARRQRADARRAAPQPRLHDRRGGLVVPAAAAVGHAQGFSFFDAEIPADHAAIEVPALERAGRADRSMPPSDGSRCGDGQRFFLFVQVDGRDADTAVARLSAALKQQRLYDQATIVIVGDHGEAGSGMSLDDTALRIPLIVKQPNGEGGGPPRPAPVQHIDLLPDDSRSRARARARRPARPIAALRFSTTTTRRFAEQPIYAESFAAYFRFGGTPTVCADRRSLPLRARRRGGARRSRSAGRRSQRRRVHRGRPPPAIALDRMLASATVTPPARAARRRRGALRAARLSERVSAAHRRRDDARRERTEIDGRRAPRGRVLIGQKKYSAGIRALQAIVHTHPHARRGSLSAWRAAAADGTPRRGHSGVRHRARAAAGCGRRCAGARRCADARRPNGHGARAGRRGDRAGRARGHPRALADGARDGRARRAGREGSRGGDASCRGRARRRSRACRCRSSCAAGCSTTTGNYEEARRAVRTRRRMCCASMAARCRSAPVSRRIARPARSVCRCRSAVSRRAAAPIPRNVQAYTSLAMLYRASNRDAEVEDVLNELVAATPTPEGYAVAARLWTILGERSRAEALRSDARARFRGDPSLAQREQDGRR